MLYYCIFLSSITLCDIAFRHLFDLLPRIVRTVRLEAQMRHRVGRRVADCLVHGLHRLVLVSTRCCAVHQLRHMVVMLRLLKRLLILLIMLLVMLLGQSRRRSNQTALWRTNGDEFGRLHKLNRLRQSLTMLSQMLLLLQTRHINHMQLLAVHGRRSNGVQLFRCLHQRNRWLMIRSLQLLLYSMVGRVVLQRGLMLGVLGCGIDDMFRRRRPHQVYRLLLDLHDRPLMGLLLCMRHDWSLGNFALLVRIHCWCVRSLIAVGVRLLLLLLLANCFRCRNHRLVLLGRMKVHRMENRCCVLLLLLLLLLRLP